MDVTDTNFEKEVIEKSKEVPVVVDFWAAWCVPCNMLTPALEKVVESYDRKVELVKVNVDEAPQTSNKFGINAIPNVKIFKDGEIATEFKGVVPEETIRQHVEKAL